MTLEDYYNEMIEESECSKIQFDNVSKWGKLPNDVEGNFKYKFTHLPLYDDLCSKYNLVEIAGNNNTLSKALNIMEWLSENTYYCGSSPFGADTTENILEYSFGKGFDKAINCVNKAIVLSDFLMSINIFALPVWITNEVMDVNSKYFGHGTSHVVVHVYLPEVERWIMLDPSFNAYLVDEDNSILNIIEILERYKTGKPIYIGQYSFNKSSELFKEHYVKRFIITALGRIGIWGGNSYEERKYFLGSYNLIPQNMNYKGFLEKMMTLDILNEQLKDSLKDHIEHLKYISVSDLLLKP